MRKIFFVALATLALVGCQNQSQSQLDFDDVSGKAVVQGYVYVDRGFKQDGTTLVAVNEPAEGCAVVVKVPYQEYDANATSGDKMFTAVCDANGFYTVEIPVGQAAITGARIYTRPFVGTYYELTNAQIMETTASFPETSTAVDIENGKTFMAANMVVSKDVTIPNLSRQQVVTLSGQIAERYEKRTWIDVTDKTLGDTVSAGVQDATKAVQLQLEFVDMSNPSSERLIYNVTTDATGAYNLTVNLFDTWNISDVVVEVTAKSYLNEVTHYYKRYDEDNMDWKYQTQQVTGYYEGTQTTDDLREGDKLIGHTFGKMILNFVPNYAKETIYGIGNIDIDWKDGNLMYHSDNVLGWSY